MQKRSERASLFSNTDCIFHLPKNLGLTQNHGIKSAGHTKRMSDREVMIMQIDVGGE